MELLGVYSISPSTLPFFLISKVFLGVFFFWEGIIVGKVVNLGEGPNLL